MITNEDELSSAQQALCRKYGAPWHDTPLSLKVAIARDLRSGTVPLNGMRQSRTVEASGWYIWAGEEVPRPAPEFFMHLPAVHLAEWKPRILRFLALPPGWRFLTDDDYEDVWSDPTLLLA